MLLLLLLFSAHLLRASSAGCSSTHADQTNTSLRSKPRLRNSHAITCRGWQSVEEAERVSTLRRGIADNRSRMAMDLLGGSISGGAAKPVRVLQADGTLGVVEEAVEGGGGRSEKRAGIAGAKNVEAVLTENADIAKCFEGLGWNRRTKQFEGQPDWAVLHSRLDVLRSNLLKEAERCVLQRCVGVESHFLRRSGCLLAGFASTTSATLLSCCCRSTLTSICCPDVSRPAVLIVGCSGLVVGCAQKKTADGAHNRSVPDLRRHFREAPLDHRRRQGQDRADLEPVSVARVAWRRRAAWPRSAHHPACSDGAPEHLGLRRRRQVDARVGHDDVPGRLPTRCLAALSWTDRLSFVGRCDQVLQKLYDQFDHRPVDRITSMCHDEINQRIITFGNRARVWKVQVCNQLSVAGVRARL